MFRYGKLARQAVSAVSYIVEVHGQNGPAVSSGDVGRERRIPKALAAKLLSEIASAGILKGTTGPGGGYRLARDPSEISLMDVVSLVERPAIDSVCPYGPGWCGTGEKCPLHDDFARIEENGLSFLKDTSFAVFAKMKPGDLPG